MSHDDLHIRQKPRTVAEAEQQITRYAKVLNFKGAQEPILHPVVRREVFEWLREFQFERDFLEVGLKARRRALLFGPPGCGKTTLAHHLSARLGKDLVCVEPEGIIDCWIGSSAKNLGGLFDCLDVLGDQVVVLFDEFDSLAAKRISKSGGDREIVNMVNVLLRRIEQVEAVTIAATNRADSLDPAVWRRFDIQIDVVLPGHEERYAILKRYADPFELVHEDLDLLTELTEGASPSLLQQLMENMKRKLVLAKRTKLDISNPKAVFEQIVASVIPPPDFPKPALWCDQKYLERTATLKWPPIRKA